MILNYRGSCMSIGKVKCSNCNVTVECVFDSINDLVCDYCGYPLLYDIPLELVEKPYVCIDDDYLIHSGLLEGYNGKPINIEIPDNCIAIGDRAFFNCQSLENVYIPDSVMEIGEEAFANCKNLKHVRLPSCLSKINKNTFSRCFSLESVSLPQTLTLLGDGTFFMCRSLRDVVFSKNLVSIGRIAFCLCEELEQIKLPSGLKRIGWGAFSSSGLKSVIIPDSVLRIESQAFSDCRNLHDVYFTDNGKTIDTHAFDNTPYHIDKNKGGKML